MNSSGYSKIYLRFVDLTPRLIISLATVQEPLNDDRQRKLYAFVYNHLVDLLFYVIDIKIIAFPFFISVDEGL